MAMSGVISAAYPPAAPWFAAGQKLFELLEATGYLGTAQDPAETIKLVNARLDALERRMGTLKRQLGEVQNEVFRTRNMARVRQLGNLHDKSQSLAFALEQKPTERATKLTLANDARLNANKFVTDRDLWMWSDMALRDHRWAGRAVQAGQVLAPDFKPMPTLEYYTTALVTWMAAIEYAAGDNRDWVKATYGAALQRHISFLSVRPGWNELRDQPETLPEQIKTRVLGMYIPNKYPEKRVCTINEYSQDSIARQIRYVQSLFHTTASNNELCNVPEGLLKLATSREEQLQAVYGTELMAVLKEKLTRLKDRGTLVPPIWETAPLFAPSGWTPPQFPALLYSIADDGILRWHRHNGAEDGTFAWQKSNEIGTSWRAGFKQVIPDSGGVLYAITRDGTLLWYRHMDYFNGSPTWAAGPKEIGTSWAHFKHVFSGGEGVIYAITENGDLLWYRYLRRNTGATGADAWKGPIKVGNGWGHFKHVFSAGEGVIYAVTQEGTLEWRRHHGWKTGGGYDTWTRPGHCVITKDWSDYTHAFAAHDGILYAIAPNGDLLWFKHGNYLHGAPLRVLGIPRCKLPQWDGPKKVGWGWGSFTSVFAILPQEPAPVK